MLALKITPHEAVYARALRVIGQDVADLLPENLEIEFADDHFIARGRGRDTSLPDPTPRRAKSWRRLLRRNSAGEQAEPKRSMASFSLTYTQEDIDRLDAEAAAQRRGGDSTPDLYSLAERLRMIGRVVDGADAKLIKVRKRGNSIQFEFRDKNGESHRQELSNLELYKLQQQYYSERNTAPADDCWEWADRIK